MDKTWNYEARSLVRDRKKIVASVKNPCQELLRLGRDLSGINKAPFHGLRLKLQCCENVNHCLGTSEEEAMCFDPVVDKIPLEYFSVELAQVTEKSESCGAVKFFIRIVNECSFKFREFSVRADKPSAFLLSPDIIQDREFPVLQILNFSVHFIYSPPSSVSFVEDSDFKLMFRILSRAPSLREIHHNGSLKIIKQVLHMSQAVNVYTSESVQCWDKLPENLLSRVKFQILRIQDIDFNFSVERFYEILSSALENSHQTLQVVKMDCVMAMPLSTCCLLPLENVKKLEIEVDYHYFELVHPAVLRLLRNFDFRRVFPNLKHIEFYKGRGLIQLDIIRRIVGGAEMPQPLPNRGLNIEYIRLHECLKDYTIRFFAEICPNIKKLRASFERGTWAPYSLIWSYWKELEDLQVFSPGVFSVVPYAGEQEPPKKNLDAEFCGIHPKEVEELLKQDEEFLKAVHIVPVQPAITCLSGTVATSQNLIRID